jgi:hypothetical protein
MWICMIFCPMCIIYAFIAFILVNTITAIEYVVIFSAEAAEDDASFQVLEQWRVFRCFACSRRSQICCLLQVLRTISFFALKMRR